MADANADFRVTISGEDQSKEAFDSVIEGAKRLGEVLGVGMGLDALKEGIKEVVTAFGEQQAAETQTATVLKSTGDVSGVTAEQVKSFAEETAKSTQYSAVQTTQLENLMLTFKNVGSNVFPQATQATLDMAQAMGMDLQNATIMVGKALQDPITGMANLRRVGVTLDQSQQDLVKSFVNTGQSAKAQQLIIGELESEFGGSAKMFGQTVPGQLAILGHSFESMKETAGALVSGALAPLMMRFADFVEKNQNTIVAVVGTSIAVGGLAAALGVLAFAITAINVEMLPIIGLFVVFAALLGSQLYPAIKNIINATQSHTDAAADNAKALGTQSNATNTLSKSAEKLQEQLKGIQEQMDKANTNFKENLADMINAAEQKVVDLKDALNQENNDFAQSQQDKLDKYNQTMEDMNMTRERYLEDNAKSLARENEAYADAVKKKTDQYTKQITLELEKGTEVSKLKAESLRQAEAGELADLKDSHQQKLDDLSQSLSRETVDYSKHVDATNDQYQKDTANATMQHAKKVDVTTDSLNKEQSLLNRHAQEIMQVRGMTSLDEIDKLERSHNEAIKSYQDQIAKAKQAAGETTGAMGAGFDTQKLMAATTGEAIGTGLVKGIGGAFTKEWDKFKNKFKDGLGGLVDLMNTGNISGDTSKENGFFKFMNKIDPMGKPHAGGGAVKAGETYQVNENGQEFFTPSTSGNVVPIGAGGGSGGGSGINITIQGDLVVDSEERKNELIREISYMMGRQGQMALNGGL